MVKKGVIGVKKCVWKIVRLVCVSVGFCMDELVCMKWREMFD